VGHRAYRPSEKVHLSTGVLCVQGATGTAYEGLTFRLSLAFTAEYPFKAPTVRFETPCFHPNVDMHGNICLDILKEKWSGKACACMTVALVSGRLTTSVATVCSGL
jgi:ubiquitin-protein ligase